MVPRVVRDLGGSLRHNMESSYQKDLTKAILDLRKESGEAGDYEMNQIMKVAESNRTQDF